MGYVGVCDVVEHLVQHTVVPVHSGKCAPQPVPFQRVIVGQRRMCVLKERDQDQESVHDEQWHTIDADDPPNTAGSHKAEKCKGNSEDADVGDENLEALTVAVDGAIGVVVAGKAVIFATRDVEGKVEGPAEGEGGNKSEEAARGVVKVFGVPGELGFGLGDEDFIAFKAASVGMVAAVAVLPGEVGDEEKGVKDDANSIVQPRVV